MSETIVAYITKYALSGGIQLVVGTVDVDATYFRAAGNRGFVLYHGEGREWHRTAESALARAEQMRVDKLSSLERQIAKIRKADFAKQLGKVTPPNPTT